MRRSTQVPRSPAGGVISGDGTLAIRFELRIAQHRWQARDFSAVTAVTKTGPTRAATGSTAGVLPAGLACWVPWVSGALVGQRRRTAALSRTVPPAALGHPPLLQGLATLVAATALLMAAATTAQAHKRPGLYLPADRGGPAVVPGQVTLTFDQPPWSWAPSSSSRALSARKAAAAPS